MLLICQKALLAQNLLASPPTLMRKCVSIGSFHDASACTASPPSPHPIDVRISVVMARKSKSRKHQSPLVQAASGDADKKKEKADYSQKKRKRSKKDIEDEAEERRLTALLFGGQTLLDESDEEEEQARYTQGSSEAQESGALFELDTKGDDDDEPNDEQQDQNNDEVDSDGDEKPAWVDEDDVELDMMKSNRLKKLRTHRDENVSNMKGKELERRLRKRFETTTMTTARTDWATVEESEVVEEEDTSAAPLLAATSSRLPPQILQVVRCPDANQKDPNQAAVQAVHFHPGSDPDRPLMLTAGLDKTLRFFQVGPDESDKIHGIHFPKLPIHSAQFLGDTGNVVVSGRRPYFYIYDAAVGKLDLVPRIMGREEKSWEKFTTSPDGKTIAFIGNDGYIVLVDVKSKQWKMNFKMNGSARAVTFTPNGDYLLASGSDGDVYKFDLRSRTCVERFANEDGTITSSLSASFKHLAVGAESGVVNMYSSRRQKAAATNPVKSIMNLHTSADFTRFNHDGNILAFSTRRDKSNSLKLLHVPTATVFSNWPTSKTPLSYVWSVDFSPESKYLAIGNDKGKVLLYKLLHYHD